MNEDIEKTQILLLVEEMRLKIITIEARVNTLEARADDDETWKMEQNERR